MNALDLDLVRTFVAVAHRGSFSAAATTVWRSQAAVSQQIQRLEAQLGETLLSRSSREVRLTPAGERFLGYAQRLLRLSEEAAEAVRGPSRTLIRIGATDDIATYALMPVLADLRRERADLAFEIVTGFTRDLLRQLGTQCDLVLGIALSGSPSGTTLATLALKWMGDWTGRGVLPLALYPEGCLMRGQALAALDGAGVPWEIAVAASGAASMEAAARSRLAVAPVVAGLCATDLPAVRGLPALPEVDVRLFAASGAEGTAQPIAASIAGHLRARRGGRRTR